MKILAIVVTYYPEKDLLISNINAFLDDVDRVLVWENTPCEEKCKYRFIEHEKVNYCGDGNNSISRALNYAWRYAKENDYNYILTMDQDSILYNFKAMKNYAINHLYEKIIIGPYLETYNTVLHPSISNKSSCAVKVESLITSGTLIYVEVLDVVNGYDDNLVIDGIDTDLCLRSNLHSIYSYQIPNCSLIQRFGEPKIGHFMGKRHLYSSYSPVRLMGILRSHIYLMRKYKSMSFEMRKYIIQHYIINKLFEIILFEDHKVAKVSAMLNGIYQGFRIKYEME